MSGVLILEDGTCFPGKVFGYMGKNQGEVVFNTGMTGYQEVLTDPSYYGQIVIMTYPLIGNYGINIDDKESLKSHVRGFVVREKSMFYENYRASESLEEFLASHKIVGLEGVDTRALTRHLRNKGTMRGIITTAYDMGKTDFEEFSRNQVQMVTTDKILKYPNPGGKKLAVLDLGLKQSILKGLLSKNFAVDVYPAWTTIEELEKANPDGIFLSNGPGDPKDAKNAIEIVKYFLGKKPICGICLGHQIISLALGADTYKMKFGHRGLNQPVKDLRSNRVFITSQNHGYAVKEESLGSDLYVSHRNLNDNTVEGVSHKTLPVLSVQYHPEAAPGPADSMYLFDDFYKLIEGVKNA
ncbi:MAG: carbamoyl-phosphate synthase small subunit [Clostridia bacterium]|nr:carbamoyl-phosphate synthase small subunit [Clostridia bacterium]